MLVVLFILLLSTVVRADPPGSSGTVEGVVTFRADGSPVPYANIIIVGERLGAMTDESGRFRINGIPWGTHIVKTLWPGGESRADTIDVAPLTGPMNLRIVLDVPPDQLPIRIGSKAAVSAGDIDATIQPIGQFRVGDKPRFEVRIRNNGSSPVRLVRVVEDTYRRAHPPAWIKIVGPPDGWVTTEKEVLGDGGNFPGAQVSDFVEVAPGESYDPRATGADLSRGTFRKPGHYWATFRFKTDSTSPRSWSKSSCSRCDVPGDIRELLEGMPALDLIAVTSFDVAP